MLARARSPDPELRDRFGAQGRKRVVAHFSWDAIAERTIDLYRLERHSGGLSQRLLSKPEAI